jgi:undecaprenyl diphosphate synthase
MITGDDLWAAPNKIDAVVIWCQEVNQLLDDRIRGSLGNDSERTIRGITFHISTPDPDSVLPLVPSIRTINRHARLILHLAEHTEITGKGIDVEVAVGKSGRDEIVACIRAMADAGLSPEDIDEKTFERYLTFRYTPDLVIKTGGYHLTDFLIWQSVYSELFFSDVNWKLFRRIDFFRALRDYQERVRKFGK